ncbi:type 1 fimbrial protein [Glaciimonas soli]|uniref:Type 1 fimbrial protein n=1 Tax=Glaciimonas soli TaxID=2590999 RepID=A0A843YR22_9BURK|nr:type 1 fimbrial protein [Glaciimonas soli]MQR01550.1 hypothetical protein [Glaciimonas soli]
MKLIARTIIATAFIATTSIAFAASAPGGTIHFSGRIVESPCTFDTAATEQSANTINANCPRPAAFDISFNNAKNAAGPALSNVTLTQGGKALSKDQMQRVNLQFSGQKSLNVIANGEKNSSGKTDPVVMTVTYL